MLLQPVIVDENGVEIEGECSGYLCIKKSWPGAFRTLYGDHERYETTYFKPFAGYYFSGDGCSRLVFLIFDAHNILSKSLALISLNLRLGCVNYIFAVLCFKYRKHQKVVVKMSGIIMLSALDFVSGIKMDTIGLPEELTMSSMSGIL